MSKTFKSDNELAKTISAHRWNDRFLVEIEDPKHLIAINLSDNNAPALALAILEAAGVEASSPHYGANDDPHWNLRWASHHLGRSIELIEAKVAEAREQAELEAEALELWRAFQSSRVDGVHASLPTFATLPDGGKVIWLAVARKAREMRAEK